MTAPKPEPPAKKKDDHRQRITAAIGRYADRHQAKPPQGYLTKPLSKKQARRYGGKR